MAVLRSLGQLFLILALIFVGLCLFVWLDGRYMDPAGRVWFEVHLPSLNYLEVIIARHLNLPDFWHNAVVPYLQLPAWEATLWPVIVFLVLGGVFSLAGRRRPRRKSGFE